MAQRYPEEARKHGTQRLKAISLRQPWAEEIMRGRKRIEYRSNPTKVRGPIYVYAALGRRSADKEAEFEGEVGYPIGDLPRGVIVGTVEIVDCSFDGDGYG